MPLSPISGSGVGAGPQASAAVSCNELASSTAVMRECMSAAAAVTALAQKLCKVRRLRCTCRQCRIALMRREMSSRAVFASMSIH